MRPTLAVRFPAGETEEYDTCLRHCREISLFISVCVSLVEYLVTQVGAALEQQATDRGSTRIRREATILRSRCPWARGDETMRTAVAAHRAAPVVSRPETGNRAPVPPLHHRRPRKWIGRSQMNRSAFTLAIDCINCINMVKAGIYVKNAAIAFSHARRLRRRVAWKRAPGTCSAVYRAPSNFDRQSECLSPTTSSDAGTPGPSRGAMGQYVFKTDATRACSAVLHDIGVVCRELGSRGMLMKPPN